MKFKNMQIENKKLIFNTDILNWFETLIGNSFPRLIFEGFLSFNATSASYHIHNGRIIFDLNNPFLKELTRQSLILDVINEAYHPLLWQEGISYFLAELVSQDYINEQYFIEQKNGVSYNCHLGNVKKIEIYGYTFEGIVGDKKYSIENQCIILLIDEAGNQIMIEAIPHDYELKEIFITLDKENIDGRLSHSAINLCNTIQVGEKAWRKFDASS